MAKRLTEEEAQERLGEADFALYGRYPWAQWTDGSWWQIDKKTDFLIDTDNMRRTLVLHGQRHSMKAHVHRRGDTLIFRFTDNE
jgi:hypothetical protein